MTEFINACDVLQCYRSLSESSRGS